MVLSLSVARVSPTLNEKYKFSLPDKILKYRKTK